MKERLDQVFNKEFDFQPLDWSDEGSERLPQFIADRILIKESEVYLVKSEDEVDTYVSVWLSPDKRQIFGRVIDVVGSRIVGATSFMNSPLEDRTPIIGSTDTNPDYQRKGLAARRTAIINSICKSRFGQTLSSSNIRTPDADAFWRRLVAEGLAEETATLAGAKTFKLL